MQRTKVLNDELNRYPLNTEIAGCPAMTPVRSIHGPPSPLCKASYGTLGTYMELSDNVNLLSSVPSKAPRSEAPSLLRNYPSSSVLWASPTPGPTMTKCHVVGRDPTSDRASHVAQLTFLACRSHYPGGDVGCSRWFLPRRPTAFAVFQAARRSRLHFRGLLRIHSRYGLQGRSPPLVDPCPRRFSRLYKPASRVATKLNHQFLRRNLHPLVNCALVAH